MSEILTYTFMQRAFVAGAMVGILCAVIGVFVVHKGLSFMGAGIAHASFGGVAIGIWTGFNPVLSAIAFSLLVGWGIAWLSLKSRVREDTSIGIFFASTMALGIMLISLTEGYHQDLFGYMFGSILSVTRTDLWIITAVAVVVAGCLLLFGKEQVFTIFDPEGAAVAGISTTRHHFLLITLITLTVAVSIKVVGIVLVSALLITPTAAAGNFSNNIRGIAIYAGAIGLLSTLSGLVLSYWWDTPSGATIVLTVTAIFLASLIYAHARR